MSVQCFCCNAIFEDYQELANHVKNSKTGHRKSKKWAAKVLLNVTRLNQKKELQQRTPLTAEQKESYQETKRELTGTQQNIITYCPSCKQGHRENLPSEFIKSEQAWRTPRGTLIILCQNCK